MCLPIQIVATANRTGVAGRVLPQHRGVDDEEARAVVARNSTGCVRHRLADGPIRTFRVRYALDSGGLYIPAWAGLDLWSAPGPLTLECDVSEVDRQSCWRYVWLRGTGSALQPTGASRERRAWREGISILRRTIPGMAPTDELAIANFGVVRMEVESFIGSAVSWGDVGSWSDAVTTP